MTRDTGRFERDVDIWLESEGTVRAPGWLHDAVMAKAVHTPQRPAWLVGLRSLSEGIPGSTGGSRWIGRLVIVVALLLLVLVAAWAVGSRRPAPIPNVTNGQILVARQTDGPVAGYFTLNADGSGERLLFEAQDCGQCAFWSPNGQRIMLPEVSNGRLQTAIVRADGAAKVVLQPLPDSTVNLGPGGWSADGSLVAMAGWDDTDPTLRGIYVAQADGTDLQQVSTSPDGRPQDWPAFSPDGSKLLFIAEDPVGPAGGGIAGDLMVVNIDGTGQRQVNPPGTKVVATTESGRPMDWSPDGSRIAFAAIESDLNAGRSSIFVVPASGGTPVRVGDAEEWAVSVDWAPTGEQLLSGDRTGGVESIWTIDATTGERTNLWRSTSEDRACCGTWSPDGALILFERGPEGAHDLWTMRPDGSVVEQITRSPADYVWYSWAAASD
jgi:Tol biopolymer transport system component